MSESLKTYKGFDKDLKCHGGYQYEIGKEYKEETAIACECGFHACEMPLDVFNHYAPAGNRFCEVEQSGDISRHGSDSKIASTKIKIGAEIGIPGLVKAQIEWVKNAIGFDAAIKKAKESPDEHATGYQGAASATGTRGAASATGLDSVALAAGKDGKVMGSIGCAIFAVERGDWNGKTYPIISVAAAIVDGEKIKENTWYKAVNGELIEAQKYKRKRKDDQL